MSKSRSELKDELVDREAIRDCLYRYSRGIDRCDMELLRTAYWPGAIDQHSGFNGTVEQFIEWAAPRLQQMESSVHMLGNIFIRIEGTTAAVESYFWSVLVLPMAPRETLVCGRYLDRFERRGDEWRIAERMVVHDWLRQYADTADWSKGFFGIADLERGALGPQDKSSSWLGLR